MRWIVRLLPCAALVLATGLIAPAAEDPPAGFKSLFNGKDFTGWKVPEGDNGHWKVKDGVIDYDAKSEAKGDRNLRTEKSFKDFVLRIDWKLKTDKGYANKVPVILPDGTHKKDADGKEIRVEIDDADSGIYLRGSSKAQVNIWMWPVGSGEVYGYRTDAKMSPEVRAGVTPKKKADKPRGEWNTFEIKVVGDRLWVKLNDEEVIANAHLPGIPAEGPIVLQHHGGWDAKNERWTGPPSLVQFRNISIKELKSNNQGKLEGTKWSNLATTIKGADIPADVITLEFTKDGRIVYKAGPQKYTGKFVLEGDDDVTFLLDQELSGRKDHKEKITISGDKLTMTDSDGTSLTFVRAK